MDRYPNSYDVNVASELNAHIRYLAESGEENSCLFIRYLDNAVEIPVYKRCFKTKPAVVSPLIRTSYVGREELQNIRVILASQGFHLRLRHSPKMRFLNQISAPIPVSDPLFPLKIRSILTSVAGVLGEKMPDRVLVGYDTFTLAEPLPGKLYFASKLSQIAFELGKKHGSKFRRR